MPGGDRTGPFGMGPVTGRGAGYCTGYGAPDYMNPGPGFGYGYGFGRRGGFFGRGPRRGSGPCWGWGYRYYNAAPAPWPAVYTRPDAGSEKEFLAEDIKSLKEQLALMEKRLEELVREQGAENK